MIGPAYRIVTPRLVIRCYEPRDAAMVKAAIDASLPELKRFMSWAHGEPTDSETKVALLRQFRGRFDLGQDFVYGIFDAAERECVGGAGLHTQKAPHVREIGYWIATTHTKNGYATEAASALAQVAFRVDRAGRLELRSLPDNAASVAVARKIGMQLEGTARSAHVWHDGTTRDMLVFSATPADLDRMPARLVPIEAFGAAGERLTEPNAR